MCFDSVVTAPAFAKFAKLVSLKLTARASILTFRNLTLTSANAKIFYRWYSCAGFSRASQLRVSHVEHAQCLSKTLDRRLGRFTRSLFAAAVGRDSPCRRTGTVERMLQVVGLALGSPAHSCLVFTSSFFFMGSVRVGASLQKIQLSEIEAS